MQIQVNTDHTIEGHEALADRIRGVVENALSRMGDRITRVEVHLTDESGPKSRANNKRCMMEARLEGRQPIAVTDEAATVDLAVDGAADKLARLIEHTLGKLHDEQTHRTDPPLSDPHSLRSVMIDTTVSLAVDDREGTSDQAFCILCDSNRSISIGCGVAGIWPTCSPRPCPAALSAKRGYSAIAMTIRAE